MNLQSLVVVVLRLMALDFLVWAAAQTAPSMIRMMYVYKDVRGTGSDSIMISYWLTFAGMVVAAVLTWCFAIPIARFVTRGVSQDISFGAMALADCYSIAFMTVGLFYIAKHLPLVMTWTHYLFKAAASDSGKSWKETVNWYDISQAYIPFIIGVVLFVNGRKWAVALARRQTESSVPSAESGEKHELDN